MYYLRVFIVVLQELHFYYNVYRDVLVCSVKSMCIPSFILIGCCFSELQAHLCPYHSVWPEAVFFLELHCLPTI